MLVSNPTPVAGPGLDRFRFPADQALLVVGDVHGRSQALHALLEAMGGIATPGQHRHLVFLGDLVDRGPDSLGALRLALGAGRDLARADATTILPGNHELMLADALEAVSRTPAAEGSADATGAGPEAGDPHVPAAVRLWQGNGGETVLDELPAGVGVPAGVARPGATPAAVDALRRLASLLPHPGHASFAAMVRSWPSHVRLGDVLCVHAGLAPKHPHAHTLDLPQSAHLPVGWDMQVSDRHWAWIRGRFLTWQGGWPEDGRRGTDGVLVLHGHTIPSRLSSRSLRTAADLQRIFCRMRTNARVCLDGGASLGLGVAGALVTAQGVRLLHARDQACTGGLHGRSGPNPMTS